MLCEIKRLTISFSIVLFIFIATFGIPILVTNNPQIKISFFLMGIMFITLTIILYGYAYKNMKDILKDIDKDPCE